MGGRQWLLKTESQSEAGLFSWWSSLCWAPPGSLLPLPVQVLAEELSCNR